MANTTEEHFVVSIQVKKINRTVATDRFETVAGPRSKSSIASITVSAPDLETLRQKIQAHVALIDDGGEIEV